MANNTLIGALRAEATLESGKFVDGAKKIRKESKATEAQLKRDFSSMGAAVKGFGGALTAGLSIGLLGGLEHYEPTLPIDRRLLDEVGVFAPEVVILPVASFKSQAAAAGALAEYNWTRLGARARMVIHE